MNEHTHAAEPKFLQILGDGKSGWRRRAWVLWALLGPGVLASLANNDAGGVISYAVTGAQYGIGLFVPLVICLAPLSFTIQELSIRLGAVAQEGLARIALRRYGRFSAYSLVSILALGNLLTLMSEFIGMTAGLVLLGLSLPLASTACLVLVAAFVLLTGYWVKERVALSMGVLNGVFLVVAAMTQPRPVELGRAFAAWHAPNGGQGAFLWYVIATVGNAVAPWMIFFQGSGTIDKGVTSRELRFSRIDAALGCVLQVAIAAGVIVSGAALFGRVGDMSRAGPADLLQSLGRLAGRWPAVLFGIGLFDAGFLASITVALSSSWSIAELFGWSKSLDDKISDAPRFYGIYVGTMAVAAAAVLIPGLPLNFMAIVTQVISGTLMAPLLIFMILIASDSRLMGKHRSSVSALMWQWTMAAMLTALSVTVVGAILLGIR